MMFDSKRRKGRVLLSFLMIVFSFVTESIEAGRDRGARCEKPDYIPNGSYRIRRDRVMRVTCNTGFLLQGPKTIDCIRGKWDGEKPVCAKKGCVTGLEQPPNGRIQIEGEVKAILYCSDNYNLAGNRHSYCNGSHWDRPIGNCRERKNVVQHECDFETDDICGWTYEPREGLEWKRVMAANVFTTFKTGPRHDHTTLTANGGHYMLMESLTRQNDYVTLTSPIYDRALTLRTACCFQFYYFMYGAGVGDLFVVVKPVSLDLEDLLKSHKDLIKFQKYGNQNNIWNEAHFNIEEFDEDFQILFAAKSGRGQLSDIAVDDVKLLTGADCRALSSKDEEESNEEYDSTTYESIFEMQSCAGRCFDSSGSGLVRSFGHLKGLCNCDIDCEDNETCCPDYRKVCLNELFSQSTLATETEVVPRKNESSKILTTTTEASTLNTTPKTTPKTTTTIRTTTAKITTPTTLKTTTPTTRRSTLATTRTTASTAATTASTPKRSTTKTTTTTTTTATTTASTTTSTTITTPPTTSRKITPRTATSTTTPATTTTTTRRTTPISRKTTPTTTAATTPKTTPATTKTTPTTRATTRKTTPTTIKIKTTTKVTQTPTPTVKRTTSTRATPTHTTTSTQSYTSTARRAPDATSTRRPLPTSKSIEYIITDKSKADAASRGSSGMLLYAFFMILVLILAGAAYKRFYDGAVSWYMIRFKQHTSGDEDSSSITTSLKRPPATVTRTSNSTVKRNGSSRPSWLNRIRKPSNTRNTMQTPLVSEDDDNDYDVVGRHGNIALRNDIYTQL